MRLRHERVEVHAPGALLDASRERREERVHEHGLAAADAAVQIHALRTRLRRGSVVAPEDADVVRAETPRRVLAAEKRATRRRQARPEVLEALQRLDLPRVRAQRPLANASTVPSQRAILVLARRRSGPPRSLADGPVRLGDPRTRTAKHRGAARQVQPRGGRQPRQPGRHASRHGTCRSIAAPRTLLPNVHLLDRIQRNSAGWRSELSHFNDYLYIGKNHDRLKTRQRFALFSPFRRQGGHGESHLVRARVSEKARSQPFIARACHVPRLERTSRRYHRGSSKRLLEKALDDRGINPGCAFSPPRISPRDVPRWLPRPPVR